ncbi:Small HspC2 heat shock protein [hydrothermal vent metagenome]|uniref:Small HspC2 heat shock protein n=1 Tax=hydrothermal vent metagenome TaxID=652676 RepID=A0A3B0XBD9_9ZZZZ
MNLQKLNPWNWFKHEESAGAGEQAGERYIPLKRDSANTDLSTHYQRSPQSILQLNRNINRLFDEVFNNSGFPLSGSLAGPLTNSLAGSWMGTSVIRPKLNISSDEHHYNISLELPGLKESDILVEVKNDVLTIQGTVDDKKEDKDQHFYRIERSYGSFQRTLSLPDDANSSDIRASMKDGVLNLVIPRNEEVNSDVRKIAVNREE